MSHKHKHSRTGQTNRHSVHSNLKIDLGGFFVLILDLDLFSTVVLCTDVVVVVMLVVQESTHGKP